MNMIYFIICGLGGFFLSLWISFAISGGITPKRDELSGLRKFSVEGEVEPYDWARAALIGVIFGLSAGTARIAAGWGLAVFIVMLAVMAYLTLWGIAEANRAQEVLAYAATLFVASLIADTAAARTLSMFGDKHVILLAVVAIARVVSIAVIIFFALTDCLRHEKNEKNRNVFRYSRIGVIILMAILVLTIIF